MNLDSVMSSIARPSPAHIQVLHFMGEYLRSNDNMPTVKEITAHFGWHSSNTAHGHLRALENKGHIEPIPGRRSKYRFKREGATK